MFGRDARCPYCGRRSAAANYLCADCAGFNSSTITEGRGLGSGEASATREPFASAAGESGRPSEVVEEQMEKRKARVASAGQ
jgi:DNA-directed RNA polymerase subunit RPC12/RpoP